MKKLFVFLLVLTLLLPSTTAYANTKAEILNLPPFVDFEVTEKKKVDVIVDIGNTSHSVSTINSVINSTLRPQLAAKGLDYKIIVEDTNEGIDHFYFEVYSGVDAAINGGIYHYDILSRKLTKKVDASRVQPDKYLRVKGYNHQRNSLFYYDITNQYLHTNYGYNYDLKLDKYDTLAYGSFLGNKSYFFSDGSYVTQYDNNNLQYRHTLSYGEVYRDNLNKMTYRVIKSRKISDDNTYIPDMRRTPDGKIYFYYKYSNDYVRDNLYLNRLNNFKDLNEEIQRIPNMPSLFLSSKIFYYDENHLVIYRPVARSGGFYYESFSEAYIYNINTGATTRAAHLDATGQWYGGYDILNYGSFDIDNRLSDGRYLAPHRDGIFMAESILHPYVKVSNLPRTTGYYDGNLVKWQATYGNYVAITIDHSDGQGSAADLYLFNTETLEWIFIMTLQPHYHGVNPSKGSYQALIYSYPVDYDPKKVLIKDVINKKQHRYDADVYYIRIDDSQVGQLNAAKTLSETANLFNEQNMMFIGVGNTTATASHYNLLNLIDNRGKLYTYTNLTTALNQATDFIINKKDVDLHVLRSATSPFTAAQLQALTNQVRNDLRASNYVVNVHQVNVTPNNLLNQIQAINWNDYRNNYVLSFDSTALNELNTEEIVSTIASNMNSHYAHFVSYGTTSNRTKRNSVFSLMNNRGYISQTTNATTTTNEIKNYIIQTAESNPKRHINKLVLKHDPATDQYSSEINLNAYYYDQEGDRQKAERFKTEHDPTVYENHTGLMANTGVYLNSALTRFTKVGKYEIVAQKQDTPTNNKAAFANYDLWSEDSLSRLVLYVHRQPVAQFQAYFNSSNQFVVNDLSYDLDNYSKHAKGLMKWDWKYKRTTDADWIYGKPSGLNANYEYMIALKVQDIDEAWSNDYISYVGKNAPPVAYFEVQPAKTSWTKNPIITDRSYSPSGLAITARQWKVYRAGKLLINSTSQPTAATIKQAANQHFTNAVGQYEVELTVRDSANQWSDAYKTKFELINYEPIPLFNIPQPLYRDSLLKVENLTGTKDLDGETITFNWTFTKNSRNFTYTSASPQFTIKNLNLGAEAVGRWEVTMSAKDTLNKEGRLIKQFEVLNHIPTSEISGDNIAYLADVKTYAGKPFDEDTEDRTNLQSYWKVTKPSGEQILYYTKDILLTFEQKGKFLFEHWVVDQIGDSSEVYKKEVAVLNKAPIADFTITPNPTYRGIDVQFKSLAYDEDGHITSYLYSAENEAGITTLLSTDYDFTRLFSSMGQIKVTHTVTDNDGESNSMTKTLHILNRKPIVQLTFPNSTSQHSPNILTDRSPIFTWKYADEDLDKQQQVELRIDPIFQAGKQASATSILLQQQGTATQLTTKNLSLYNEQLYKVTARANDGYDWSEWSTPVYFLFFDNIAPEAGFVFSPKHLFEGDSTLLYHRVADVNNDVLKIQYELTTEAGQKLFYPSASTTYTVLPNEYNGYAFTYKSDIAQTINVKQTVTDEKAGPVTYTRPVVFHPLTLTANVMHTNQWESYRDQYNSKNTTEHAWTEKQFYAGEKFMLVAHTTDIDSVNTDSKVYPVKVEAYFPTTDKTILLGRVGQTSKFVGEYYEEQLNELKNGIYTFEFTVQYSNGVIKHDAVQIEIIGKAISFIGVHRLK